VARPLPSVRALTGESACLGGPSTRREGACMSLLRTADRIDYSIRRYIHATSPRVSTPGHSPIQGKWCSSKQVDSRSR
jgi:hypothetical protein